MLITRYGLPVAVIQPLDIDPWESRIPAPTVPDLEEPPIDWDALALTDAQELLMAELDDRFLNTGDVVFVHLELKGLVETAFGGDCHLTGLGRRVRDALRE
jgi:hypothetical protein